MKTSTKLLGCALAFLLLAGCGSDSSGPDEAGQGRVTIATVPDDIPAPWTLSARGLVSISGSGSAVLDELPVGDYTISWGNCIGDAFTWLAPEAESCTLEDSGDCRLTGRYSLDGWVSVPAGTFTMGSPETELGAEDDEWPQHEVTLTRGFLMQSTEVTRGQYTEMLQWAYDRGYCHWDDAWGMVTVIDDLDGSGSVLYFAFEEVFQEFELEFIEGYFFCADPHVPVALVSWHGAAAYCDWLNLRFNLPRTYDHADWSWISETPYEAPGFRLPTEAEWEYACRAGSSTGYSNGEITNEDCDDNLLSEVGWYCGNEGYLGVRAVGLLPANAWGLCDMHGNVYEWCEDRYDDEFYDSGPAVDPFCQAMNPYRVCRGGGYWSRAVSCRSANRNYEAVDGAHDIWPVGFRPVRSLPGE